MCPLLGSSVQERHEHIRESLTKGKEGDEGAGGSLTGRKVERAGTVQPQEEKAQDAQTPQRKSKKYSQTLLKGAQRQDKRQSAQTEI